MTDERSRAIALTRAANDRAMARQNAHEFEEWADRTLMMKPEVTPRDLAHLAVRQAKVLRRLVAMVGGLIAEREACHPAYIHPGLYEALECGHLVPPPRTEDYVGEDGAAIEAAKGGE